MKKEYNFSKGVRGKFYRPRKIQKTVRLDQDVLDFYQKLARTNSIPYQTLINLSLRKFVAEKGSIIIKPISRDYSRRSSRAPNTTTVGWT